MVNCNLLRGKIVSNGYTQDDVARKIKISANTFSAKMNGKSEFDLGEVEMLCDLLGISDPKEIRDIFLCKPSQTRDSQGMNT